MSRISLVGFALMVPLLAQQTKPDVAVRAVDPVKTQPLKLSVSIGGADLLADAVQRKRSWKVEELTSGAQPRPISVRFAERAPGVPAGAGEILLHLRSPVDLAAHQYRVTFIPSGSSKTSVVPRSPSKRAAPFLSFISEDDPEKVVAVDVTGALQAGVNATPNYAWQAKVKLLKDIDEGRFGSIGGQFVGIANQKRDLDPDAMKASLRYEYEYVFKPKWYLLIDSDALGYEFQRKATPVTLDDGSSAVLIAKNANLMTGAEARLVMPPVHNFAPSVVAGIEVGNNLSNFKNPNGSGLVYRPLMGVNVFGLRNRFGPFQRVEMLGQYRLRLPRRPEAFSEIIDGVAVGRLTIKPRHYASLKTDFGFNAGLALSVNYLWGSLPPAFQFVDHQITVGLSLKLKQNRF